MVLLVLMIQSQLFSVKPAGLASDDSILLPKTLLLMKFKEKLKYRKVTQVLRYPVVKSDIFPEDYVFYL